MNMHFEIHEFKANGSCSSTNMTIRSTLEEEKRELINEEGLEMQSKRAFLENKLGEVRRVDFSSLAPTRILVMESSNNPVMDGEWDKSIERVSASISKLPLKRIDHTLRSGGIGKEEVGALAI